MNHAIWAEDLSDATVRALRSRYYGELSYIDQCLGMILDEVEAGPDGGRNTLICFVSVSALPAFSLLPVSLLTRAVFVQDHGDGLGDHRMWQKENYFEEACRIPFLVSWPAHPVLGKLGGTVDNRLAGQADLFGIITAAAGREELRDGVSIMSQLAAGPDPHDDGSGAGREHFFGLYSEPGSQQFKIMVRSRKTTMLSRSDCFRLRKASVLQTGTSTSTWPTAGVSCSSTSMGIL